MPDSNASTPNAIDLLKEATEQYVNEIADDGAVLTTAVIVWEATAMSPDGSGVTYESNYAVVTDTSMSSAVGLMTVAKRMLLDDVLNDAFEDDE